MRRLNNKGQTGGLITSLVFGVASLVIGVIIAFVIVSTLSDANLLTSGRETNSASNETGFINSTSYTLTGITDQVPGTFTILFATNATSGLTIPANNYTVDGDGVVTNTGDTLWPTVNFSYTNLIKTDVEASEERLSSNFSAGIDNISSKIPTVLLIAAVILILGVLAILIGVWERMRMGGGASL